MDYRQNPSRGRTTGSMRPTSTPRGTKNSRLGKRDRHAGHGIGLGVIGIVGVLVVGIVVAVIVVSRNGEPASQTTKQDSQAATSAAKSTSPSNSATLPASTRRQQDEKDYEQLRTKLVTLIKNEWFDDARKCQQEMLAINKRLVQGALDDAKQNPSDRSATATHGIELINQRNSITTTIVDFECKSIDGKAESLEAQIEYKKNYAFDIGELKKLHDQKVELYKKEEALRAEELKFLQNDDAEMNPLKLALKSLL